MKNRRLFALIICGSAVMTPELFALRVKQIGLGCFENPFVVGGVIRPGPAQVNLNALGFGREGEGLVRGNFEGIGDNGNGDAHGRIGGAAGHHGRKPPTWEGTDGSKVVGELKSRQPSTDSNAIPWLLLVAKHHEGNGIFSRISTIQRLETVGGKPPTEAPAPSALGTELRVPYTATYYFYTSDR